MKKKNYFAFSKLFFNFYSSIYTYIFNRVKL